MTFKQLQQRAKLYDLTLIKLDNVHKRYRLESYQCYSHQPTLKDVEREIIYFAENNRFFAQRCTRDRQTFEIKSVYCN